MKCKCCNNRIWIEPSFKDGVVQIMTKKGEATVIETGIEMSIEEAIEFAQDILNSTKSELYYVIQVKKYGVFGANYVYGPFSKEDADKQVTARKEVLGSQYDVFVSFKMS